MPITKQEYKAEMYYTSLEKRIEEFINSNPNLAYSLSDVTEALNLQRGKDFFADLISTLVVQNSLDTLVKSNKIGSRVVRGTVFYSAL